MQEFVIASEFGKNHTKSKQTPKISHQIQSKAFECHEVLVAFFKQPHFLDAEVPQYLRAYAVAFKLYFTAFLTLHTDENAAVLG